MTLEQFEKNEICSAADRAVLRDPKIREVVASALQHRAEVGGASVSLRSAVAAELGKTPTDLPPKLKSVLDKLEARQPIAE